MSHRSGALLIGLFFLFLGGLQAEDKPSRTGPTDKGFVLPNGWTITLAGRQVTLTDLPLNIVSQFNVANSAGCISYYPSSMDTVALLVGLGDGSVRPINNGVSQTTFNLTMISSDGLPLPSDW